MALVFGMLQYSTVQCSVPDKYCSLVTPRSTLRYSIEFDGKVWGKHGGRNPEEAGCR